MPAWNPPHVTAQAAEDLARKLDLPVPLVCVLMGRGMHEEGCVQRFLRPRLSDMPDPFLLTGMDAAAERLVQAITDGESVVLYGDYDVDGVTSTAVLQDFLLHHGLRAHAYIPHRLTEGYGLNAAAVDVIAARGARLVVTLDCGVTAVDEIGRANEAGMDVVVVDHHRCPAQLPRAVATLNPHQPGCAYPDKVLAAVGVTFNLVVAVRKKLRERGLYGAGGPEEPNLKRLLDLVALGTIADMVPLTGVNRLLTWFGLDELRLARRPGVRALMEVSEVRPRQLSSRDVGFKLAPRINAAGRLDDARVGVELLTSSRMDEARRHAAALDAANADRRIIQGEVFSEAEALAAEQATAAAIVVAGEWHPGVVGIVASKLVESFARPVVVVGAGGRGSGRTYGDVHLYDALQACSEHLVKFGGHRAAAGVRIEPERVPGFRAALCAAVEREDVARPPEATSVDVILAADEVGLPLAKAFTRLEPFGIGNPEPVCLLAHEAVQRSDIVGGRHLKLRLGAGSRALSAIGFRLGDRLDEVSGGGRLDFAFHLGINDFGGLERAELRVQDFWPADLTESLAG